MKAKVKATGEIVDIHNHPHYPDMWYGAGLPYSTSQLEFLANQTSPSSRSLEQFSDQELRDELKRRTLTRKANNAVFRCRDCKYCVPGKCYKFGMETSVCQLKPKLKEGPDCYYATLHSRKACENFEPK